MLDDDVIIKADGGLGLGASIMAVSCGQRLMSKHFAHNFIMARLSIEQDFSSSMPELMGGKADACLIPERVLYLAAEARLVLGFAVPPGEEMGVMAGCEVHPPLIDIGLDAFADACRQEEVQRLIVLDLIAWDVDVHALCLPGDMLIEAQALKIGKAHRCKHQDLDGNSCLTQKLCLFGDARRACSFCHGFSLVP